MINVVQCDGCIHSKVCGKKNVYNSLAEKVNDVSITTSDNGIWYAKDCDDVLISVNCKHFQKSQPTFTMQHELELQPVEFPKVYYEGYEAAMKGEKLDETKSCVWQCGFIDALKKLSPMSFR